MFRITTKNISKYNRPKGEAITGTYRTKGPLRFGLCRETGAYSDYTGGDPATAWVKTPEHTIVLYDDDEVVDIEWEA